MQREKIPVEWGWVGRSGNREEVVACGQERGDRVVDVGSRGLGERDLEVEPKDGL